MNLPVVETIVFVIISKSLKLSPRDRNMLFFLNLKISAENVLINFSSLGIIVSRQTAKRDKLHISPKKRQALAF